MSSTPGPGSRSKALPPLPPLIPLLQGGGGTRKRRRRRLSECGGDDNKLLRLCGGGDSDSGVSVHSGDVEETVGYARLDSVACARRDSVASARLDSVGSARRDSVASDRRNSVASDRLDSVRLDSVASVRLDPIPAVVLDSLTLAGCVSAEAAVRTCHHATHEWEESPPMISDNEVQGLLNGLVEEGEGEGEDVACCQQRQESLLQQQPTQEIDGQATVARRKSMRRRRERSSLTDDSGELLHEKHRKRSTSTSTTSSACSTSSPPHPRRHRHKHRHRPRPPRPRVNPIFVWVKMQEDDTRIAEVLCEDYDKRNRIRLTKTPQGWRATPRTQRLSCASIQTTLVPPPPVQCSTSSHVTPDRQQTKALAEEEMPDARVDTHDTRDRGVETGGELDVVDHALSDHAISDHALEDHAVEDHALDDHAVEDHGLSDQALTDHALSDHTLAEMTDNALSDHGLSAQCLSNHALLDHAMSDHALADDSISSRTTTDHALLDHAVSDHAVKDHALSDHALEDHAVADYALSDHEEDYAPCDEPADNVGADKVGADNVGADKVGADNVGADNVGADKVGEGKVGEDKVGEDKMGEDKMGDDKMGEDKMGEDKVGEDKMGEDKVGDDNIDDDNVDEDKCPTLDNVDDSVVSERNSSHVASAASVDVAQPVSGAVHESASVAASLLEPTVQQETRRGVDEDVIVPDTTTITTTPTPTTDAVDDLMPTDLTLPKSRDETLRCPSVTPVRSMAAILSRSSPGVHQSLFLESLLSAPRTHHSVSKQGDTMCRPLDLGRTAHEGGTVRPLDLGRTATESGTARGRTATEGESARGRMAAEGENARGRTATVREACRPLDVGRTAKRSNGSPTAAIKRDLEEPKLSCKVEHATLKTLLNRRQEQILKEEKQEGRKDRKSRLLELLTSEPPNPRAPDMDALTQLKKILSDPDMAIPDPLLVPRDRLQDLVTCPAKEIPRLLTLRPELRLPQALAYPSLLQDPNLLVVSLSYLQSLLRSPDKPPHKDDDAYSTLGAFLEWQRCQMQHEYLDQYQMMWLPYLSQLEASAASCAGNNQEFLNMLNAVFPAGYPAAGCAAGYPQGFPAGIYPPGVMPGAYSNQMQIQHTLAAWQEAVMASAMTSPKPAMDAHHPRHSPNKCVSSSAARTSPMGPNFRPPSRPAGGPRHVAPSRQPRSHQQHRSAAPTFDPTRPSVTCTPVFDPSRVKCDPTRPTVTCKPLFDPSKVKCDPTRPTVTCKPLYDTSKVKRDPPSPSVTLFDPSKVKSDRPRPTVTCKPLRNLLSSPRRDEITPKRPPSTSHTPPHCHLLAALGTPQDARHAHTLAARSGKQRERRLPALSPSLLKQEIKPEVGSTTPLHPNLWHPLFGSQKPSYNSPWQWTTVTVNGE